MLVVQEKTCHPLPKVHSWQVAELGPDLAHTWACPLGVDKLETVTWLLTLLLGQSLNKGSPHHPGAL